MWRVDLYGYSSFSLIRKATNREKPKTHDSPVDICMTPLVCRIIIMKAYTCLFSCFSAVLLFFCNHCLHFFFVTYHFPLILIKVNWFERCGLRNDLFFALQALLLLQETPHLIVIPNDSYFMRFVVVICEVNMCTFQVDMSIFSLLIVRGWVLRHSSGLTIYSIWALMTSCVNALSS